MVVTLVIKKDKHDGWSLYHRKTVGKVVWDEYIMDIKDYSYDKEEGFFCVTNFSGDVLFEVKAEVELIKLGKK